MPKLKLGELCAGYGGLGLAVEEAFGAELAWYSEFDAAPSKIMATHWPDVPNHGDMTQIDWSAVEPVDIISGGTPCQDLSNAGRRKGMTEGTRSNLWVNMREAIATIKPTYVVWENVRGAYSAKATSDLEFCPGCMGGGGRAGEHVLRALGRVLGDLSDLGYDTQWRGLRAADVGAPHGRCRVFILATRRDAADANLQRREEQQQPAVSAEPEHAPLGGDHSVLPERLATTGHANDQRGDGSRERAEENRRGQPAHAGGIAAYAEHHGHASSTGGRGDGTTVAPGAGRGREQTVNDGESARGHLADSEPGRFQTNWGVYAPAIRRWESVRGAAPAPTELTAKGKHRLSARFAEWMMGVEPGWVSDVDISRNDQLKAIGNGVVPQQAVAALRDMISFQLDGR